jgi:hypothetical protein
MLVRTVGTLVRTSQGHHATEDNVARGRHNYRNSKTLLRDINNKNGIKNRDIIHANGIDRFHSTQNYGNRIVGLARAVSSSNPTAISLPCCKTMQSQLLLFLKTVNLLSSAEKSDDLLSGCDGAIWLSRLLVAAVGLGNWSDIVAINRISIKVWAVPGQCGGGHGRAGTAHEDKSAARRRYPF